MKILIGSLNTETNTFSPLPTAMAAFEEQGFLRRNASAAPDRTLFGPLLAAWRALAEAEGLLVQETISASAQPGGRMTQSTYAGLRDMMLADAAEARPDIVLLALHGAMVAEGCDDCEGDLLSRLRALLGARATIAVLLDPHCHLTRARLAAADLIVAYKEYPHTDVGARGYELFRLALAAARGEIRPVMRAADCAMVAMWRTTVEPGAGLVRALIEAEARPGILSASLAHGFPWGDVPEMGARTLVVADGDAALAERTALELAARVQETGAAGMGEFLSPAAAVAAAAAAPCGLVVLADAADNPGGGAASDSTFLPLALIEAGLPAACGILWDPVAAALCRDAGEGTELQLRLGGKVGPCSGDPLDLVVTVRRVLSGYVQRGLGGAAVPLGDTVVVRAGKLDIVVSSIRAQIFDPAVFTDHGIDISACRVLAVKSIEHFRAAFAPVAAEILYVTTPGALRMDFAAIPYLRREGAFFPRDPMRPPLPV